MPILIPEILRLVFEQLIINDLSKDGDVSMSNFILSGKEPFEIARLYFLKVKHVLVFDDHICLKTNDKVLFKANFTNAALPIILMMLKATFETIRFKCSPPDEICNVIRKLLVSKSDESETFKACYFEKKFPQKLFHEFNTLKIFDRVVIKSPLKIAELLLLEKLQSFSFEFGINLRNLYVQNEFKFCGVKSVDIGITGWNGRVTRTLFRNLLPKISSTFCSTRYVRLWFSNHYQRPVQIKDWRSLLKEINQFDVTKIQKYAKPKCQTSITFPFRTKATKTKIVAEVYKLPEFEITKYAIRKTINVENMLIFFTLFFNSS